MALFGLDQGWCILSVSVESILSELKTAETAARQELAQATNQGALQAFRSKYLGKKSVLQRALSSLGALELDARKKLGQETNRIKCELEEAFQGQQDQVQQGGRDDKSFDPTLPGRAVWIGHLHPITQVLNEIKSIFVQMGFDTAFGPEVEDDWHNFEALNQPPHHPARDMQDTFYVSDRILLRTHTSPVQIRVMEKQKPPIRIIAPGQVYRNEEISARSFCLFHQVEGLYVDEDVSFADLKGTLSFFVKRLFGPNTRSKFRPSFFPFTEPSAEMDIECFLCNGNGCSVCKRTGWLEILGCGMVDPNVFSFVNVDSEKYTGYAFGMGVERIAQLRFGIDDIRLFFESDKRFLEQF